jgi:Helix-turn-helix domain
MTVDSPAWLTTKAAAAYLSMTPRQLEHYRSAGGGPPYAPIGRNIRYNRILLEDWLRKRLQSSTAEVRP